MQRSTEYSYNYCKLYFEDQSLKEIAFWNQHLDIISLHTACIIIAATYSSVESKSLHLLNLE